MQRIGVVGPKDSVERIVDVVSKLELEIEIIPYIYHNVNETSDIVRNNFMKMKGWLFSGPTPYMAAVDAFGEQENFDYCSFSDASLYKCLLQVASQQKNVLSRLSIDISKYENLQEGIEELGIPLQNVNIQYYDIHSKPQDLADIHIALWKAGKIDAVITGLGAVFDILKRDTDIPTYRNNVTAQIIRESMRRLIRRIRISYLKNTQVGFEIFEVLDFDELVDRVGIPYGLQHLELKIKSRLLTLCERLNGYLLERGRGSYEIFSSRGVIEQETALLKDVIQQLSDIEDVTMAVGIGFGDTVSSAQLNARRGLSHAKKRDKERIIIVEDNGVLIESVGQSDEIKYVSYSDDKEFLEKLHQGNVSVKTFRKIEAVVRSMGWDSFTASQLADEMGVTERNIRRIISGLSTAGLVENIGDGNAAVRGRPSKIYRIK